MGLPCKLFVRYDFRLTLHNMKKNVNMNTLTRMEKESIWVPQLVFFNTEEKVTTVNDAKAFAVTRFYFAFFVFLSSLLT